MSDRSPLFINAAEVLIHAVELFRQVDERKYKFIVRHLANAVELLVQDRLIDAGQSIYEPTKPVVINIWKALDGLRKIHVKIPERPMLDLLIEARNTAQHRLEQPNLKTVYYYLDAVTAFFKRFLRDEYGVELADVLRELRLPEGELQLLGVLEGQQNERAFLEKLFELSPESAILQAFKFIEAKLSELLFIQQGYLELKSRKSLLLAPQRSTELQQLLDGLIEGGFLTRTQVDQLDQLRTARNYAVYRDQREVDHPDWEAALQIAMEFLDGLNRAIEADYFSDTDENAVDDFEAGIQG
jgi:hypothetical protein